MKNLMILLLLTMTFSVGAQDYTTSTDNDPAAKAILDKLRVRFSEFKTVTADFSLEIEIPEVTTEVQKGKLLQKGDKYRAELDSRSILSDGNNVWVYLGNNKEVQIHCADDFADEGMMSPKDLLTVYEQEDFVYYLSNEFRQDNKVVQQIEFKPTDRDSEYSKLRLTLEKESLNIVRMKVFSKDGSRFTLNMSSFVPNKAIEDASFVWNKEDCSDCYVEDLRVDCE